FKVNLGNCPALSKLLLALSQIPYGEKNRILVQYRLGHGQYDRLGYLYVTGHLGQIWRHHPIGLGLFLAGGAIANPGL
ncbi:MAG: hypothetical protein VW972_05280, partial [Flavobacteriaceae bacterium]